ncbi:MAG TPA: SMC family ATPase [Pyrinomonadaceae bacterium]|nr:SMC family ATPase [Pyrinomonadaceae bacterium]
MHISRIELENIKSHASAAFDLERGTTAITGPNGAGKTSLIEAIAWVMFDHLDYKKDEFVRRGEKKGWARVTFRSNLDDRDYIIYRDTGAGYHVTDPKLDKRIAEKKEEVTRFLWTHLGLEPGTDLKSLFRQAIGVPQGTFTAIFLEGATERKSTFDRLLKVEEYRQAAEKLRETVRYLDAQTADIREKIARGEGELARSEQVAAEFETVGKEIEQIEKAASTAKHSADALKNIVTSLDVLAEVERSISSSNTEQKRLLDELEKIASAHKEIADLKPKATEQEKIDAEIHDVRSKVAVARDRASQAAALETRVVRLRESYKANAEELRDAQSKSELAAVLPQLETTERSLVEKIATARAELDRDRRFQAEVKNGLCPILSEKCLNLKDGQTLESFISSQFDELQSVIDASEKERTSLSSEIAKAKGAQRSALRVEALKKREDELKTEGTHLNAEKAELEKQIGELPELEAKLAYLEKRIADLGDPRTKIKLLEREIARENEVRRAAGEVEKNLERLTAERAETLENLEDHADSLSDGSYDSDIHLAKRNEFSTAEKRHAELTATLAATTRRRDQLAKEIEHFEKVRESIGGGLREKERLEEVSAATAFIRDTLKEAAPRVARNYIHHISIEANQLFREITGNGERSLKWTEDYAIMIDDTGFERPFVSLSGGEQMAAALSVRLALLKQLTDIRIAFFDEPTTNMDAERRENLAIEISRITHFDQLFVVSHDETFDNYVDNVLVV